MGLTKKLTSQGKKMVMTPAVMRFISDDRVMKAAEGVMDARTRVRAAWKVLLSGHDLPTVDPALDDSLGEPVNAHATNGHANGHGSNGHASEISLGRSGTSNGPSRPPVTAGASTTETLDQA